MDNFLLNNISNEKQFIISKIINQCYEFKPEVQDQQDGAVQRMQIRFLKELNLFYFRLLETDLNWSEYQKYINGKREGGTFPYFGNLKYGFSFSSDDKTYVFLSQNNIKIGSQNSIEIQDDRKHAIAALTFEYIIFFQQFVNYCDNQKSILIQKAQPFLEQQKGKKSSLFPKDILVNCPPEVLDLYQPDTFAYKCMKEFSKVYFNLSQIQFQAQQQSQFMAGHIPHGDIFTLPPLTKANYFMRALGSQRIFKDINEIKNWKSWEVYWSNQYHKAYCYSTCSGTCNQYCQEVPCIYVFPEREQHYQNLPDVEKSDPRNIFDDNLYFLAYQFHKFTEQLYKL
ncbi:hypothetical protein ABPG74_019063 [Tetrahymena malaccensis]